MFMFEILVIMLVILNPLHLPSSPSTGVVSVLLGIKKTVFEQHPFEIFWF
ncbi:hypothetical protein HanRHA438_Chr08g0359631 [Helianthus annuus]|nr:hypothetical protein HanRHA438_Chr08g0359631 [Helianthus annuus]